MRLGLTADAVPATVGFDAEEPPTPVVDLLLAPPPPTARSGKSIALVVALLWFAGVAATEAVAGEEACKGLGMAACMEPARKRLSESDLETVCCKDGGMCGIAGMFCITPHRG